MTRILSALLDHAPRGLLERLKTWKRTYPVVARLLEPAAHQLRHREVVIRHGPARGLRIDTTGAPIEYGLGLVEPDVQAAVVDHLQAGDTFYDIGANIGFFTLVGAQRVGPAGRVLAFEPAPVTAAALTANVQRNGFGHVRVIELAVAAQPGRARFVIPDTENQEARLAGLGRANGAPGREVEVDVTTIDHLVAGGAPAPTFVKMDVEGAEVAALTGMRDTLQTYRPVILCEVHGTDREVEALLTDLGYVVRPLLPTATTTETDHLLATPRPA